MTVVESVIDIASNLTWGELFILLGILSGVLEAYLRASGTEYDSQVKYLLIVLQAIRGSKTVSKGNEEEISESDPQRVLEEETEGSVVSELDLEKLLEESAGEKETEEMGNRNVEEDESENSGSENGSE
jgi:hypothetical protein